MNSFYKGLTNNHLTWVMVDATDFATPESAMSAATAIKIYGKVRGGTGVNFVSSGAGSLTNDIQHVGASATGIYTIALVKADLSDASNAWYDQYIITLSATGAARQTLVVDGGIFPSAILAMSGMLSDTHSAAILAASTASEAQSNAILAASRILLVQSRLSDFMSAIYPSDISDIRSMLTALSGLLSDTHSAAAAGTSQATHGASRVLLVQSRLSDFMSAIYPSDISDLRSYLSDIHSDLKSALGAVSVVLTDSNISDIASAVVAGIGFDASDAASAVWAHAVGTRVDSRILVTQSTASEAQSQAVLAASRILLVQSRLSDFMSATYPSDISDIRSMLTALSGTLSDAHSAATAGTSQATHAASRVLLVQSRLSDFTSAVYPSDISDIRSMLTALSGLISDAHSAAILGASHASAAGVAATAAASRAALLQSSVSDVQSAIVVLDDFIDTEVAAVLAAVDTEIAAILALLDDARGEPGQGTPAVNPDLATKIDYLYKAWRNRTTQTASEYALYADDGTTKDQEAACTDDGVTFVRGEIQTGA